jgi:hypothetical protein
MEHNRFQKRSGIGAERDRAIKLPYYEAFGLKQATLSRFQRVLTMAYNTQNYWVFGLFPSSGIVQNRKHDVSEAGSVSVLK